jgi:hypothetical protein
MYQIDDSTVSATLPTPAAPGTAGYFTDGNLLGGIPPTIVPADFFNTIMLEMLSVLSAAGITPSKTSYNQLLLSIEQLIEARSGDYATDTGAANAYVVALSPVVSTYTQGLPVKFRAAHANTAACTINAGPGVVALLRDDGSAMQSGDIANGSIVSGNYDTTAGGVLVNSIVLSQLGALAKLNIGAGLVNDGSGNLTLSGTGNYPVDAGAANAYVIALNPAIVSYAGENGVTVRFRATHANTGGCTLNAGGGVVSLLRDDGGALQSGDIPANALIEATYDSTANAFLIDSIVQSELGALAHEGIGQGLKDDGSGNLTLKLADSSIRVTTAGVQSNEPVAYISTPVTLTVANHMGNFVSTATATLTVPLTTTTWNGYAFSANAQTGTITVIPNAADKINGGVAGASYLVPNGTSAEFVGDGAGNIDVFYQTAVPGASPAPQYISTSQSISSGQYAVDTSGVAPSTGPVSLTLPASPPVGTPIVLYDAEDTWAVNNVTLISGGGGNTINGSALNFTLDVSGASVLLVYKSGNWGIE